VWNNGWYKTRRTLSPFSTGTARTELPWGQCWTYPVRSLIFSEKCRGSQRSCSEQSPWFCSALNALVVGECVTALFVYNFSYPYIREGSTLNCSMFEYFDLKRPKKHSLKCGRNNPARTHTHAHAHTHTVYVSYKREISKGRFACCFTHICTTICNDRSQGRPSDIVSARHIYVKKRVQFVFAIDVFVCADAVVSLRKPPNYSLRSADTIQTRYLADCNHKHA
jgi:hypothetical protein